MSRKHSEYDEETRTWSVKVGGSGLQVLHNVHSIKDCTGDTCIVHNPSDTVANREGWGYDFRETGVVERTCDHGVGHPDKDSVAYLELTTGETHWGIHGCDGCCAEPEEVQALQEAELQAIAEENEFFNGYEAAVTDLTEWLRETVEEQYALKLVTAEQHIAVLKLMHEFDLRFNYVLRD